MSTAYAEGETYSIHWDDEIDAAVLEWDSFPREEQFKEGMRKVLDCVEDNGGRKQMADSRAFKALNDDYKQWTFEEWTPRAMEVGVEAIAIVYPESTIAEMSHDEMQDEGKEAPIDQYFSNDLDDAREWIGEQ